MLDEKMRMNWCRGTATNVMVGDRAEKKINEQPTGTDSSTFSLVINEGVRCRQMNQCHEVGVWC